jgi:hypothetical protein
MARKVAEIFIETLVNAGVERVYGVAGDSRYPGGLPGQPPAHGDGLSPRAQLRHAAVEIGNGDTNQAWMPHPVG